MKKSIYRYLLEQKEDWQEFAEIIGLKNTLQQMAVGAAMCVILFVFVGCGMSLAKLISGC